jgi:hypothetical protein
VSGVRPFYGTIVACRHERVKLSKAHCAATIMLTLSTRDHTIFRICLIPSQCEAFRYQGRMSNFNFSDICFSAEIQYTHDRVTSLFVDHFIPL